MGFVKECEGRRHPLERPAFGARAVGVPAAKEENLRVSRVCKGSPNFLLELR